MKAAFGTSILFAANWSCQPRHVANTSAGEVILAISSRRSTPYASASARMSVCRSVAALHFTSVSASVALVAM